MTRPNKSSSFYFLGETPNKLIESHTITTQPIRHHSRISIRAPHPTAQITPRPQPHFFSLLLFKPLFLSRCLLSHQDDTATQIKPKPVQRTQNTTTQERKKKAQRPRGRPRQLGKEWAVRSQLDGSDRG